MNHRFATIIIFFLVLLSCNLHGQTGDLGELRIFLLDEKNKIEAKNTSEPGALPWNGNAVSLLREADLPDKSVFDGDTWRLSLKYHGLRTAVDGQNSWIIEKGLSKRRSIFDTSAIRRVQAIDPAGRFLAHKHEIMFKNDQAGSFRRLATDLSRHKYLSAIYAGKRLYVGTSLNGLYESTNFKKGKIPGKMKFRRASKGLPYIPHNRGVSMYEEITALVESRQGDLYAGTSVQGGVYVRRAGSKRFKRIAWPFKVEEAVDVQAISVSTTGNELWISTSKGLVVALKNSQGGYAFTVHKWNQLAASSSFRYLAVQHKEKKKLYAWVNRRSFLFREGTIERVKRSKGRRLLYTSAYLFNKKKWPRVKRLIKSGAYNGVVIDLKDDFGYIRYDSKVPFLKKIKAVRPKLNLEKVTGWLHKNGAILVARIVVFKDPVLYRQPGFAILDRFSGKPWVGVPGERWIDPYNKSLPVKYHIPLVKELEERGVDEIQLDYIRFPSDGSVGRTRFRHRKDTGMYYSEALENFLYQVSNAVSIPVGVDVYGYHGIYRAAGVIGQDIDAFSAYVDVVSPMVYSSHFGNSYLTNRPRSKRAYKLLHHCALRSLAIARGRYTVRPYLQAFPMKNRLWGYGKKYFADQVKGGLDEGIKGFIFWGSIDHMKRAAPAIKTFNW